MGLKLLKETFNIRHMVQLTSEYPKTEKYIAIGSQYIHDIIIINKDYSVQWNTRESDNVDLVRYFKELTEASKSANLQMIIESEDIIENPIPVWTYKNGKIIKKYCEKFGWPEITIDGELMYENTFFLTRKETLKACRKDCRAYVFGRYAMFEKLIRVLKELKYFIRYTSTSIWNYIRSHLFFGY